MAGTNIIYGAGMLEMGVTFDLGMLAIDNEFIAMIRRAVEGIPVNDETLALDEIAAVGAKGNFITSEHTMRHLHDSSRGRLINRNARAKWEEKGASDIATRGRAEAKRILAEHEPTPLPANVLEELRALVEQEEARQKKEGVVSALF